MGAYGPSFWEMFLLSVLPALVSAAATFAAIFFGVLLAGRRLVSQAKPESGPSAALGIVQERYAGGELSRQEFEQMGSVLEG